MYNLTDKPKRIFSRAYCRFVLQFRNGENIGFWYLLLFVLLTAIGNINWWLYVPLIL